MERKLNSFNLDTLSYFNATLLLDAIIGFNLNSKIFRGERRCQSVQVRLAFLYGLYHVQLHVHDVCIFWKFLIRWQRDICTGFRLSITNLSS